MKLCRNSSRAGSSLVEFTILGIPMMFITISVVAISIDMWQFQSLAYATEMTARYVSVHGATCAQGGNTCTITAGNVAAFFAANAIALDPGPVNVTLTD